MNRLRVQLVLAFSLVVLVAVGAIAALVLRTTDTQFRRYITHSDMQASGSGLQQLIAYYDGAGGWEGVESLLARATFVGDLPPSPPGGEFTRRFTAPAGAVDVILADARSRVVYDSTGEATGEKLPRADRSKALPIARDDGEVIGYLLLSLPGGDDRLGELEQRFLDRMRNILITGAALAVGVALVMGALLSRSLTAPLQRLAAAARAVATGDLGHRVRAEGSDELIEVARAFNDMTTALGESERQRRNMVADVAHELRSPLTVLQGNLRAMLDGVYELDVAEISSLYDETRLLSRLVDDLRDLALADAGQLRLTLRPMDLVPLIQNATDTLASAAEGQGVTLDGRLAEDLPPVQADADRVSQVLRNLLINALRHTPPGGAVTVTATASANGSGVEVAVSDTGEGIAPENLGHVFERFWRSDPARTRTGSLGRMGGTGLGLSVAQSLVEAHGGRIWVESTPGRGSTFRFSLPAATAAP
ncbi:MAG: sensor histidine kinase [Chloroflexi bacterium]|nr:MAG: sensor histidine kinase [Chloroflexota bacterium]